MPSKSRTASRTRATKPALPPIPEPFQVISASLVTAGTAKVKVPMLVLRGEWLKAVGFPIGAAAYLDGPARRADAASACAQRAAAGADRGGEAVMRVRRPRPMPARRWIALSTGDRVAHQHFALGQANRRPSQCFVADGD